MSKFKHILLPIELGEPAAPVVDMALTLAQDPETQLTLMHAVWLPTSAYAAYVEGVYWPLDEMVVKAKNELAVVVSAAKAHHLKTAGILASGEPWRAILAKARELQCDLIVMGTHGRRGIERALVGSVAEKIVRISPVPVLTISGRAEQEAREALARSLSLDQPD